MIKFSTNVKKANNKGAGFIQFPKENNEFKICENIKVNIDSIILFTKICNFNNLGFYVPASIIKKYNLMRKEVKVSIEKIEGFFTKTGDDGRIYLPNKYSNEISLKQDEIILIEGIIDNKNYIEYCQIRVRKKAKTTEYFCVFNPSLKNKEGLFNIKSIPSRNKKDISKNLVELTKEFNFADINEEKIIAYYGNMVPIIIKKDFDLDSLAHYFGCYFSDGTKKGNSWGICASTFEQAKYFLKMHNSIIYEPKLNFEITYTDPSNDNSLKTRLNTIWLEKTNIDVPVNRIRIYNTITLDSQNRNIYGALSIKEHRQLILLYYNRILNKIISEIISKKDKKMALEFIMGVFEGDGSPSAKSRGHIVIATNKNEVKILLKIFKVLGLKHEGYDEDRNKSYIRFGSLEIIENIVLLKDDLFKYYSKRRTRTIERLLQTSAAKFLIDDCKNTSAWIKKRFRDNGILDKNNKLTSKGKKIKKALLEWKKELITAKPVTVK